MCGISCDLLEGRGSRTGADSRVSGVGRLSCGLQNTVIRGSGADGVMGDVGGGAQGGRHVSAGNE